MRQTVFSINPATGLPFIEVAAATKIIQIHIAGYSNGLLNYKLNSMEDLTQEVLVRLSNVAFDPTKSSPKTFIILVAKSRLGNIHIGENRCGRNLEVPDFIVEGEGIEFGMASQTVTIDNVTPEDILLAKEFALDFFNNTPVSKCGRKKPLSNPRGWLAFRDPWSDEKKAKRRDKLKP